MWNQLVTKPSTQWTAATGPSPEVVLSSRIRLARNLSDVPFPHRLTEAQAESVIKQVDGGVRELNLMGLPSKVDLYRLADHPSLDRQVLVDKHLISPQQAGEVRGKAVAISGDESVSIMVNEEDHLRIQCLAPGLQLEQTWQTANLVDDALEQKLSYAFHPQRGYLTACPTNLGTGMRASIMVHLPGLVLTQQAGNLFRHLSQLGLVVRGLYGEGTEASGQIFQISNQPSLGKSEEEIVQALQVVGAKVVELEKEARAHLHRENKLHVEDQVCRSYGILANARIITSNEAMRYLSDVRLGVDLGLFPKLTVRLLNELMIQMQPAFLQKQAGEELDAVARDVRRAQLIRERLGA